MKIINLFIVAVFMYTSFDTAMAQEFKIPAENTKEGKISLINFLGDVPIEGYNGKEVVITSTAEPVTVPERAKGLKPVFSGGADNTGMGLSVEKNGNQITVTCLLPITRKAGYKIRIPENMAVKYESSCDRHGTVSMQGIKNEIEIKTCHSVELKDVTGPLVISTIAGNIDVVFAGTLSGKPSSISSVSGEVDVTVPAKTATDLLLKSVTGTIYSDFDFPKSESEMRQVGGNKITNKLNGGGTGLDLVSISGNIYLRKGK